MTLKTWAYRLKAFAIFAGKFSKEGEGGGKRTALPRGEVVGMLEEVHRGTGSIDEICIAKQGGIAEFQTVARPHHNTMRRRGQTVRRKRKAKFNRLLKQNGEGKGS